MYKSDLTLWITVSFVETSIKLNRKITFWVSALSQFTECVTSTMWLKGIQTRYSVLNSVVHILEQ